jgi:hypothetical protein
MKPSSVTCGNWKKAMGKVLTLGIVEVKENL